MTKIKWTTLEVLMQNIMKMEKEVIVIAVIKVLGTNFSCVVPCVDAYTAGNETE